MQFKHAPAAVSAVFDDPNLVSAAGLVPMLRLLTRAMLVGLGLLRVVFRWYSGVSCSGSGY